MKQYESCIQNDNNNNNNNNNDNNNNNNNNNKMKKIKPKGEKERASEGGALGREKIILFFFLFVYFSNLRKLDCRFSSGLKAKLIHATRAMREHQNLGVSSNSTR